MIDFGAALFSNKPRCRGKGAIFIPALSVSRLAARKAVAIFGLSDAIAVYLAPWGPVPHNAQCVLT